MKAGKLRHKVQIQKKTAAQDNITGAVTYTWSKLADVWASIEPLSAREFIAAQAVQSKVSARITIRYRDDIDATMRILHGNKIYNIAGVLTDPKSGLEYITLPVSEGVNEG
jgi:SPP1 family predicted phage head-tail adaptor